LLQAVDVAFAYRDAQVLRQVSFLVSRGALVGLLGPNGSGKTTTLRLLAGVLAPSAGRVQLEGVDVGTIPRRELARRLAVVPQETHAAFDYRVLEIALMGRYPHLGAFELEGPADLAAARRALEATGTWHLSHRPFDALSGGERQRVVIASALAQFEGGPPEAGLDAEGPRRLRPSGDVPARDAGRVLLLDEPTASLDLRYQIELGTLLTRLNREQGLTMVVSTHDLNFAASVCRELVLLRDGRVLASGPTGAVLTRDIVRDLYDVDLDGVGRIFHFLQR
jgi:iron complex transport system ATP-binding protein